MNGDDQVAVLLDPAAGGEAADLRLVELATSRVVDVFDAGLHNAQRLVLKGPSRRKEDSTAAN